MERLTVRDEYGNADVKGLDVLDCIALVPDGTKLNLLTAALNRLAEYEDYGLEPGEMVEDTSAGGLRRLATQRDFEEVTKKDWLLFRLTRYAAEHYNYGDILVRTGCYMHKTNNELIFDEKKNLYLNVDRYLDGISRMVKDVYMLGVPAGEVE